MVKRYMVRGFNSHLPIYEEDELMEKGVISYLSGTFMHANKNTIETVIEAAHIWSLAGFNSRGMQLHKALELVLTSQCNCKSCSKLVIIGSEAIVTNKKPQALYCSIECVRKHYQSLNKKK